MLLQAAKGISSRSGRNLYLTSRKICTTSGLSTSLRRSYLYVPTSSDRMLEKSLTTTSDVIIYDLEDSIPPGPNDKDAARKRLNNFLSSSSAELLHLDRIAVRVNDISTPYFKHDITQTLSIPSVHTLILPKIHSASDLDHVSREIYNSSQLKVARSHSGSPIRIVASIESARGLWGVGDIASWKSKHGELGGQLTALLFAFEDYCADTSIMRTSSRQELLYTRSQIVVAAKAFGLDAIDMVCINYKDLDYLKDECEDGRRLGFNGKQAIHPSQIGTIHSAFVPTSKDILRAVKIIHQMELAHASQRGAFGLELEGGGIEMIDAPMLKQAEKTIQLAKAAGIVIPDVA